MNFNGTFYPKSIENPFFFSSDKITKHYEMAFFRKNKKKMVIEDGTSHGKKN